VSVSPAQLSSRAATVGGAALVGAGVLLGGFVGGITAGAALYVAWLLSPRWVAAASFGGLVFAAAATALEWTEDAVTAGRLAGIGALVAVATAAAVERSPAAQPVPRPTEQALRRAGRWVAVATVAAPGAALAVALWLAGPGEPLATRDQAVVASLQAGDGLTVAGGTGPVATEAAPLAPIVAAFLPGTPERTVLVSWLVTVLAAAALARAVRGAAAGVLAGILAAVLAALTTPRLPEALAALAIVAAATFLRPDVATIGHTVAAGVALGAATLARPDAAIVAVVALVWLAVTAGIRHPVALTGGFAATIAPWLTWYHRTFETWWAFDRTPGQAPGVWLAPISAVAVAVAVVTAAARIRARSRGGGEDRADAATSR
jgi:hypothetical protein